MHACSPLHACRPLLCHAPGFAATCVTAAWHLWAAGTDTGRVQARVQAVLRSARTHASPDPPPPHAVNYRVSVFLTKEGFYEMWNWFDDRTW